jgi:hypothetical protein
MPWESRFLKLSKEQFRFGSASFFIEIETPFWFPFVILRMVPVPVLETTKFKLGHFPDLEPTVLGNLQCWLQTSKKFRKTI